MRAKVSIVLVLAAVLLALAAAAPAIAGVRDDLQAEVLRLVNAERAERGLRAVRADAALQRAATGHARDMLARDYFSHNSLNGDTCADRARRAGYRTAGYRSWSISEVLAWGEGWKGSPEAVVDGWMHSSYHRSVILGRSWRDVGVACVQGSFRGSGTSFMYTLDFGRRVR